MPIYLGGDGSSAGNKIERWHETNSASSVADGAESAEIALTSTAGAYGHFFLMWHWDDRVSWPWRDAGSGTGFGFGVLKGQSGGNSYTYIPIVASNSSSVTSLDADSCKITNSTGATRYLQYRLQPWNFQGIM